MSRFVRASKYRHVYGQTGKKEFSYENVKVTNQAWDTDLISASGRYLSLNWLSGGGGAFAILPLPSPWGSPPHGIPYKIPDVIPLARGHAAPVLDTAWSPFDDSLVVSGGDDGRILVWKVEQNQFEGWGSDKFEPIDFEPVARIDGSARKIGQVSFHPTASHVLAGATGDHVVKLWDITDPDGARSTLGGHTDTIQSFTWNSTGTLLATTCRDRKLRLFDPRAGGEPVRVTDGHGGIKGSRVVWMGERDLIATTGFSKMSDRQVAVWETGGLGNLKTVTLDQSAGVVMPFWSDNGILFLAGKGDGNIRYYEYESDTLHALSEHKSTEPQRGLCFLPRRALNVAECEIARAYKVTGSVIEPIAFVVPRKADSFQSDIFPPAPSDEPSLSSTEFFSGKVAPRKFIDLETGSISQLNTPVASPINAFASPANSLSSASSAFLSPNSSSLLGRAAGGRSGSGSGSSGLPQNTVVQPPTPLQSQGLPERTFSGGAAYAASPTRESSSGGGGDSALAEENAKLTADLRAARTQIRNLELQVEQMRANAQRAAKVLMEASGA